MWGKGNTSFPLGCQFHGPPHLVELYIYRYAHDALYASRANYASLVLARGSRIELLNDYEFELSILFMGSKPILFFFYVTILLDVINADDITECNIVLDDNNNIDWFLDVNSLRRCKDLCVPIDSWVRRHASLKAIHEIWKCVLRRVSCNNRLAAIFLTDDTK